MGMISGPPCCSNRRGITGYGNDQAEVVLLGIAPGRKEIEEGRPFIGPSGNLANAILSACNYSRDKCYATNLCCFWKDDPNPEEIAGCSDRLLDELVERRPRLILALGALASERLTGYKVGKARGAIIRPEYNKSDWFAATAREYGITVMPTWHPAAILRVPSMGTDLVRDFMKIPRFLAGELEPILDDVDIHHITSPDTARRLWTSYIGRTVAVDVETEDDSEDSFAKVICLAATTKSNNGKFLTCVFTREALEGIQDWHENQINFLFHNGQFDTQAIYRTFGVWLPIVEDTMLMSYNADERPGYEQDKAKRGAAHGPGYHGLKTLSREYLSSGWYETEVKGTLGKSLEEMAEPQLVPADPFVKEMLDAIERAEEETESSGDKILPGLPAGTDIPEEAPEQRLGPKNRKKKLEVEMRLETPEEAKTRYEKWLKDFYTYNAMDAAHTLALMDRLPTDRDISNYRDILIPAANVYKEMQYQGIAVDRAKLDMLVTQYQPRIEALRLGLQQQAWDLGYRNEPKLKRDLKARDEYEAEHGPQTWPGYEPINLGSNLQMGNFLFRTLGLRPLMFTKKGGKPSTSADHMDLLQHPFCTALKEHNQWEHVFGTYYLGSYKHIRSDGRFHSYPWLHGTVTGRRAWTEPAMQTFPQEYTVGADLTRIKEIVIPSQPGYVLIEADYDQIEVWLGAILSGDTNMLADLQEPYHSTTGNTTPNYHSRVARNILKSPDPDDSKAFDKIRQLAKIVTFAIMYLVEAPSLAHQIGCTKREAERIIREWYARYPKFKEWQKKILQEARRVGEITTPFGYRRRFPVVLDTSADKQMVNHPIQSTGGSLTLVSLIELHQTLKAWGARVLLDVHDSLLFEAPIEHLAEVTKEIKRVMTAPKRPGWPTLGVSLKIGPNWGQMVKEDKWLAAAAA